MKDCAIIIPVYKEGLTKFERISLKQVLKIIDDYDFIIVTHKGLCLDIYRNLFSKYERKMSIEIYDKSFFESIQGYNNLMMSASFYERFNSAYKYLLIYQLDCYIFRNDLNTFISKNYDFLGAPMPKEFFTNIRDLFKQSFCKDLQPKLLMNGGFSLRKTCSFLSMCQKNNLALYKGWNEDIIFSLLCSNIPTRNESLEFSFECFPRKCLIENGNHLPMGCHAWYKNGGGNTGLYDDLFWLKKIAYLDYIKKKIRRFIFSIIKK